jgi:hypothetical protein
MITCLEASVSSGKFCSAWRNEAAAKLKALSVTNLLPSSLGVGVTDESSGAM